MGGIESPAPRTARTEGMIRSTAAWKSVIRRGYVAVVDEPTASRPHMPDYDILPAGEGSGLLPWSWAVEHLRGSRNFWVATVWPDGRPHVTAVWGVWLEDAAWFSCGLHARKLVNLRSNPRCSVATDDSNNPVVIDGEAEVITDLELIRQFLDALNVKYESKITEDFLDPGTNASVRVRPRTAYAIKHDDFQGSPTRWRFPGDHPSGR